MKSNVTVDNIHFQIQMHMLRFKVVVLVTFGRLGDAGTPGRIKLQNSIWNLRKINPDLRLLIATR